MEYLAEELQDISISKLFKWCASSVMIFGGIAPYIPQYREIRRTENADGFSMYVCLALLLANTLRILFWFGKRYELPLLLQSIFMNVSVLVMVNLCVRTKNKKQTLKRKERVFTANQGKEFSTLINPGRLYNHASGFIVFLLEVLVILLAQLKYISKHIRCKKKTRKCLAEQKKLTFTVTFKVTANYRDFDSRYFWLWTDFQSYLDFLLVFSVVSSFIMYLLLDSPAFVELVGFLAVFAEAMLGMPQLFQNYWNKSTKGMSVLMVLMWAAGDIFKTIYFLAREAPFQFWVCSLLQVSVDLLILLQVYLFKKSDLNRKD